MAFTYYTDGNYRRALKYTNELLELVPNHPRAAGNRYYYEEHLQSQKVEVQKRKGMGLYNFF